MRNVYLIAQKWGKGVRYLHEQYGWTPEVDGATIYTSPAQALDEIRSWEKLGLRVEDYRVVGFYCKLTPIA